VAAPFEPVAEATNAFKKLFQKRNWLLGLPVVVGQIVGAMLGAGAFLLVIGPTILPAATSASSKPPDITPTQIATIILVFVLAIVVASIVNAFAYAWTLAAADPVWADGDPAFDRGFNRAVSKLLQLAAFQLLILVMVLISLITIVGPIIIAVLLIYGPAFIVLGNRSATQAIADSFRLVSRNAAETMVLVLAFIVVSIAAFIPQFVLGFIPWVGILVQLAIQGILNGYIALAVVRFYGLLTIASDTPSAPVPSPST